MKREFGKEELREIFRRVGERLEKPVKVFLLGGGAMCFRDQKSATKDLDLVFESKRECDIFAAGLRALGFERQSVLESEYKKMDAAGIWQNKDGNRLDLFVEKVCNALAISEAMKARSEVLDRFGKLTVMMVSNEDVILFKGITERGRDADDIATIARAAKIDWRLVLAECIAQSGEKVWHGLLYDKLVEIKDRYDIEAPIKRELLRLYKKEIIVNAYRRYVREGLSRAKALEKLRKHGFTQKELGDV